MSELFLRQDAGRLGKYLETRCARLILCAVTGERISHYEVLRRVGSGGMGEVFLARDAELERTVALKVMSAELAKDETQRKRFRQEAKAASGLVHPNVCVVLEVGETEDGRPFLAMEYVAGQALDRLIQQRRFKIREVLTLGIEVAEALEAAHGLRIIHRDIKPANIMIDSRGHAKVLDFGLAKRFAEDELSASTSLPHTRTGMLIGTPHYMSPEQALGRELDHRSDLFSLGAVLYELIVGQKPFLGNTIGETINNVVNQQPEPLGLENPIYSPALDKIISKCLEKDPAARYPSAKLLAQDLSQLKAEAEKASFVPPIPVATPVTCSPQEDACVPRSAHRFTILAVAGTAVMLAAVVLVLLPRLGTVSRPDSGEVPAPAQPRSVAVLPFDNFSGDPEMDYLSDGLTEEITAALARVHGLKVAARNSAFTFKGRKQDLRKVGADLKVTTLLEGSVRKMGNQIRVSAQLINVADGFHLWSETYERAIGDIFAVQEDIARRIAERLQGSGTMLPAARKSVNAEAHTLYLQGRLFWNKRTEAGLRKAIQLFQEAIEKDATYADAYAATAASYFLIPLHSKDARAGDYYKLARAAANRALELDPSCAEAHAVLGSLQAEVRDWPGAEEHFLRALQLAPNYATAHHWYGRFLNARGRHQEGLKELETAIDLDPLSPVIRSTIPEYYFLNGDYPRAISEARPVVDAFPDFPLAHLMLVVSLMKNGEYEPALAELDQLQALGLPEEGECLELRAFALARLGRADEARQILAGFETQLQEGKHVEGYIAFIYLGLRDYPKALDYLEQEVAHQSTSMLAESDPFLQELNHEPRFQALVKKAGLKE